MTPSKLFLITLANASFTQVAVLGISSVCVHLTEKKA